MTDIKTAALRSIQWHSEEWQLNKTIEECGELIVALSQNITKNCSVDHIMREAADVAVQIEILKELYGIELFDKTYKARVTAINNMADSLEKAEKEYGNATS